VNEYERGQRAERAAIICYLRLCADPIITPSLSGNSQAVLDAMANTIQHGRHLDPEWVSGRIAKDAP
jgi:hypothetical protein